jgi:DNA-binding NtrC family response regulator
MDIQSVKQRFSIIGNSVGLNRAIQTAIQVAPTEISVLITGESGVGKEVFSQIIHQLSNRKYEKFIAVNCGAIPEGTIDSELFGHEKGSFTGAFEARKGWFETVNGGTIFLDEVGEMPLGTQARLLRVLEAGEFIKVGSSKVQKTNVRVIAATNVNLQDALHKGKFREDLYYRLNTVSIQIPALRERRDDIPLLFRKFSADFAEKYHTQPVRLDERAESLLKNHPWKGNIRQLKNVAEQISVLDKKRLLEGDDILGYLPESFQNNLPALIPNSGQDPVNERDLLYKVLFDMRNDLNQLKQVVANLIGSNNNNDLDDYPIPEPKNYQQKSDYSNMQTYYPQPVISNMGNQNSERRMPIDNNLEVEDVEENYSLNDVEKKMIKNALKKHSGKRKLAAVELGISERTLYRKIKEYELEN